MKFPRTNVGINLNVLRSIIGLLHPLYTSVKTCDAKKEITRVTFQIEGILALEVEN